MVDGKRETYHYVHDDIEERRYRVRHKDEVNLYRYVDEEWKYIETVNVHLKSWMLFLNSLDTVVWETLVLRATSLKDCLYFVSFKISSFTWIDMLHPIEIKAYFWLNVLLQYLHLNLICLYKIIVGKPFIGEYLIERV